MGVRHPAQPPTPSLGATTYPSAPRQQAQHCTLLQPPRRAQTHHVASTAAAGPTHHVAFSLRSAPTCLPGAEHHRHTARRRTARRAIARCRKATWHTSAQRAHPAPRHPAALARARAAICFKRTSHGSSLSTRRAARCARQGELRVLRLTESKPQPVQLLRGVPGRSGCGGGDCSHWQGPVRHVSIRLVGTRWGLLWWCIGGGARSCCFLRGAPLCRARPACGGASGRLARPVNGATAWLRRHSSRAVVILTLMSRLWSADCTPKGSRWWYT